MTWKVLATLGEAPRLFNLALQISKDCNLEALGGNIEEADVCFAGGTCAARNSLDHAGQKMQFTGWPSAIAPA
jgi:hypothetical protein